MARTVAQPDSPRREVERIILSRGPDSDPATDPAAADVLAAYEAAQEARKSTADATPPASRHGAASTQIKRWNTPRDGQSR